VCLEKRTKLPSCHSVPLAAERFSRTTLKQGHTSAQTANLNCLVAKVNMVTIHLGLHFTLPSIKILCPKKCNRKIHSRSAAANVAMDSVMSLWVTDLEAKDRVSEYSHTP